MRVCIRLKSMYKYLVLLSLLVFGLRASSFGEVPADPVKVTVTDTTKTPDVADHFLGVSYEMAALMPKTGVTLGSGPIDSQGKWPGDWKTMSNLKGTVEIAPASASIFSYPCRDIV